MGTGPYLTAVGGNGEISWVANKKAYPKSNKEIDISENRGTSKSSILIRFSIINHPFWGTPIFGNTQMVTWRKLIVGWGWLSFRDLFFLKISWLNEPKNHWALAVGLKYHLPIQKEATRVNWSLLQLFLTKSSFISFWQGCCAFTCYPSLFLGMCGSVSLAFMFGVYIHRNLWLLKRDSHPQYEWSGCPWYISWFSYLANG